MAGDGQGKQALLCKLCILFYESFEVMFVPEEEIQQVN